MRKLLLAMAILVISFTAYSQKGNNQIGVGADIGIPTGDLASLTNIGLGGYVKGLYGVGNAGQLTLTTGYNVFKVKEDLQSMFGVDKLNVRIIPIMFGYRQKFNVFFVEPQAGYSIYSAKATIGSVSSTESDGAFSWAIGVGAAMIKGFEFGVRYQSMSQDGSSDSWVGIHAGYNFSFKK